MTKHLINFSRLETFPKNAIYSVDTKGRVYAEGRCWTTNIKRFVSNTLKIKFIFGNYAFQDVVQSLSKKAQTAEEKSIQSFLSSPQGKELEQNVNKWSLTLMKKIYKIDLRTSYNQRRPQYTKKFLEVEKNWQSILKHKKYDLEEAQMRDQLLAHCANGNIDQIKEYIKKENISEILQFQCSKECSPIEAMLALDQAPELLECLLQAKNISQECWNTLLKQERISRSLTLCILSLNDHPGLMQAVKNATTLPDHFKQSFVTSLRIR